ncbi:MAG: LLM class flavin-dependent oxidoreductase [Gemmatimonadetes bacterium]|jgi:luciferase family oxidoreductase group 1|nr:LLM class flavin-dependent oxidoreductase [Gemmatimonadota bacterium]
MIPFSILDLAPIRQGADVAQAYQVMRRQAQRAEELGYHRYWLAEHHNMAGIGSTATSVLIGHVAEATHTIRVGSGGIMLPNHPPLVIAEQFGTLETLYPGRIDLGLGRAPGTDQLTARALRRERIGADHDFPRDVLELQAYFDASAADQHVRAIPGAGLQIPIWLLGSSLFSAGLASQLGLPYAFAAHFAPADLLNALTVYRGDFQPSAQLQQPHAMIGINVVAADTDQEARRLFTSMQMQSVDMARGRREPLPTPIDDIQAYWTPQEQAAVEHKLACSFVGSADTLTRSLASFIEQTGADELIVNVRIHAPEAALHCLEILAQVRDRLAQPA